MKKNLEERFGSTAVTMGLINEEQFVEAFSIQARENIENDEHRLLGEILVDLGYLTISQVYEILRSMNLSSGGVLWKKAGRMVPESMATMVKPVGRP
jgi:hypothetical protein